VDPKDGLDTEARGKNPLPLPGIEPRIGDIREYTSHIFSESESNSYKLHESCTDVVSALILIFYSPTPVFIDFTCIIIIFKLRSTVFRLLPMKLIIYL
jgi:hypothetical protein